MKTIICAILVLLAIGAANVYQLGNTTISSRANTMSPDEAFDHLMDLETGLPVDCDTDMDCLEKTGIDPSWPDPATLDL